MDQGKGHAGGQGYPGRRTREERRSLSESLADGTSKFFSSMVAKKNGLFNDLSSKLENTFAPKTDTISNSTESERSSPTTPPPAPNTPPPRPPPPKRLPSLGSSREKENVIKRMASMPAYTRSDSRPDSGQDSTCPMAPMANHRGSSSEDRFSVNGMNVSFDEPILYNTREPTSPHSNVTTHVTANVTAKASFGVTASRSEDEFRDPDRPVKTSTHEAAPLSQPRPAPRSQKSPGGSERISKSAALTSFEKNPSRNTSDSGSRTLEHGHSYDRINEQRLLEEVKQMSSEVIKLTENVTRCDDARSLSKNTEKKSDSDSGGDSAEDSHARQRAPKFTNSKRRSSTVDEMLFDDYVEPEVDAVIPVDAPPEDLICFEPDPEIDVIVHSPDSPPGDRMLAGASIDSSDVEFGGATVHRSGSVGSDKSWSSNYSVDSQPDDVTLECMEFMKLFVEKVFHPSEDISQTEKAKFGELCQYFPGRLWFSRYINSQRVHNKRVTEAAFFRLMQYFAVCLFECNEAEDFSPAKTLMNMCFTFYYEAPSSQGATEKVFLYAYMRDQPIWQSLRFWNAAFFDAVQCERSRRPMPTNSRYFYSCNLHFRTDGNETMTDDKQFQENITFGQLGTFACNMRSFGLSKELCLEFLRKQSTIANLRKDQVRLLKENIERVKDT